MRILVALSVVLAALITFHATDASARRPPDPRTITLIDQRGAPFSLHDLRSVPVLVTFVATRCRDACPIANALFANLRTRLDRDHAVATLVTVTLDPTYDTPTVMAREARKFRARVPGWRFASGSIASVHALMLALGVAAQPDPSGVPDVHSTFVYVLDARGRLARTLLLSTTLVEDATELLRDPALRRT